MTITGKTKMLTSHLAADLFIVSTTFLTLLPYRLYGRAAQMVTAYDNPPGFSCISLHWMVKYHLFWGYDLLQKKCGLY